jgi:glycosyltransferase involved in cell wall biosynthesis
MNRRKLQVLLLEPYFTGSHAAWAEGYLSHSRHAVRILKMTGQFWKWRMHGGAVTLARLFREEELRPDVILATDMLDLTTFLALTRPGTADIPAAVYFHENQITYPWSPGDRDVRYRRDRHYGFINYASALAADAVFFNSEFQRKAFLDELPRMLRHFPDHRETERVAHIAQKSRVLPLGFDFVRFDNCRPEEDRRTDGKKRSPLILWNHRWEYDKNPADFFRALSVLASKNIEFEVAILGENFSQSPQIFEQARREFGTRVVQFGFVESFREYARWLFAADLLPVTSKHDFFGMSVVEAVYCGCYPLLPRRLSYPEIFPPEECAEYYYKDTADLSGKLQKAICDLERIRATCLKKWVDRYSWAVLAPRYDGVLEDLAHV